MPTVGTALDGAFDRISTAMDDLVRTNEELVSRVRSLEERVATLEDSPEPAPVPEPEPEPVPEPPPVVDPAPDGDIIRLSELSDNRLADRDNFTLILDVEDRPVTIDRCMSFRVLSEGSTRAGTVSIHRSEGGVLERVNGGFEDGTQWSGTSFSVRESGAISFVECTSAAVAYSIWCDTSENIIVRNCVFRSAGREATIRFVSCFNTEVIQCRLINDMKHNWRVHGTSSACRISNCTVGGTGNGIMTGYDGDNVRDLLIEGNRFENTGPDLLNLKEQTHSAVLRNNVNATGIWSDIWNILRGRGFVVEGNSNE